MLPKPKPLLLAIILLIVLIASSLALAQTSSSDWSDPINLSRSGAAADPHILTDYQGTVHALWFDSYDGFSYARYQDGAWTSPAAIYTPIGSDYRDLEMVSAPDGYVHLIWRDSSNSLYYAQVNNARLNSPTAWSSSQFLVLNAVIADIAAAPDGSVHIAYIRNVASSDFPAGAYVLSKRSALGEFQDPQPLYTSPYFRGVDSSAAQVSVAAAADDLVFASWVDPGLEQLYLARSLNEGRTWDEPILVDRRQEADGFSAQGPADPLLADLGQNLLLLWSAGHQGSNCSLYFSLGEAGGESWSDPDLLPEPFQRTCPDRLQVLVAQEGAAWLFATTPSGVYTLAFDPSRGTGSPWSTPQLQTDLSTITNPATFRQVQLSCQRAALSADQLHVVGCEVTAGASETTGVASAQSGVRSGDVWHRSSQLGDPSAYFPTPTPPPIWSTPVSLVEAQLTLNPPLLIAESPDRQHAIWTQAGSSSLFYAFFDGSRWTQPISALLSPAGSPAAPSAALTSSGDLFLAWADAGDGGIYYSSVPARSALNSGAWSVPQALDLDGLYAASPQVQVDSQDRLHIAFAVPLNEGRGVYLVQSRTPLGEEVVRLAWSDPVLVFDAAAASWEMLADPRLVLCLEGAPHLLWTRYSLPPASQPLGLYYASLPGDPSSEASSAGHASLSPLEFERGQVIWSQLLITPDGTLHVAWQQRTTAGNQVLWHSYSLDDGRTWSAPVRPTGFQTAEGPASLAIDGDGRLHLLQVVPTFNGPLTLQRWQWGGGETWTAAESQPLPDLLSAQTLTSAAVRDELSSLFSALLPPSSPASEPAEPQSALLFSARSLALSGATPSPQPTFTPAPGSTTEPGSELPLSSAPTPTATLSLSASPSGGPLAGLFNNRWGGIALAAIPALVIVIAAFVFAARRLMRRG